MTDVRVLIVDDEAPVRRLLRRCLESDGYVIDEADSPLQLRAALKRHRYDLVTLDIGLGNEDGLHLIREIRAESDAIIVMITAKNDVIDKIVGLEMGADDYITKPFHVREIQARLKAILRRRDMQNNREERSEKGKTISFDRWTMDVVRYELIDDKGEVCPLTAVDFKLLSVFVSNPRRVLSRERLMDLTKGAEWSPLDRTIDNQIARLRRKVERDPTAPDLIKTVRGVGYTFTPKITYE